MSLIQAGSQSKLVPSHVDICVMEGDTSQE